MTRNDSGTSSEAPLSFAEKLGKFDARAASQARARELREQQPRMIRPSVSAAASNAGAVRAMAAMYDTEPPPADGHKRTTPESQRPALQPQRPQLKILRTSTSAPSPSQQTSGSPIRSRQSSHKYSISGPVDITDDIIRRVSLADSVASRAKQLMNSSKLQEGADLAGASPLPQKSPCLRQAAENTGPSTTRSPGNLGKMLPPQEMPPVARSLNLPRPPSTLPGTPSLGVSMLDDEARGTPAPRPGSTTLLHAQIRSLQRELHSKNEETSQLRRQLEAQECADVGTLSEQLREAKREAAMWKERAEAAERRVQVFEKFTAKLRGIREAAAVAEQQEKDLAYCSSDGGSSGDDDDSSNAENISPAQHVKFAQAKRVGRGTETCGSAGSGHTEDAGVVTARIRKCLHAGVGTDGAADVPGDGGEEYRLSSPRNDEGLDARGKSLAHRDISCSSRRNISESAMEIWVAAQELLQDRDAIVEVEGQAV